MKQLLTLISLTATFATTAAEKPNIIYILADELGINDFGCYGQKIMKTPRIDQMAKEGIQFFNHYSGSTVCAPTRSCLMTGQHTGRTRIRGNSKAHLKPEDVTVAELLKKAGYATGCVGKWGLGEAGSPGIPNKQGFDFFFGYLNQSRAHRFYPDYIWRNEKKEHYPDNPTKRETYIHDNFTREGLNWIEKQSKTDEPFFLYMAYTLSHVDLDVPDDSMEPYLKTIKEKGPYKNANSPQKGYRSHPTPRACFAGMTSRLDRDVGKILDLVDKLGLSKNTIIMFSSDNGPTPAGGADPEYFDGNGIYKGIKRDLYEGGIRAPFIARWPDTIKAGSRSNHVSAHWDLMATVSELTGTSPADDHTGISFLPSLLGKGEQKSHDHLYWEFYERGGKQAIRKGDIKAVRLDRIKSGAKGPWEIYDLSSDPGEKTNLASKRPELQAVFNKLANEAATESTLFNWKPRGGKRKKN